MRVRDRSDEELVERLKAHPELRERIGGLLLAVEDEQGDLRTADAMEMRLIEELRQMGRESLSAWANVQVRKGVEEERQVGHVWQEGKKTVLAHHVRGNRGGRAATSARIESDQALCPPCPGEPSRLFAAAAASGH